MSIRITNQDMSPKITNKDVIGVNFNSQDTKAVVFNGDFVYCKKYTISIIDGNKANITIRRIASNVISVNSPQTLNSSSEIYYGDILQITVTEKYGWSDLSYNITGLDSDNKVIDNVNIVCSATRRKWKLTVNCKKSFNQYYIDYITYEYDKYDANTSEYYSTETGTLTNTSKTFENIDWGSRFYFKIKSHVGGVSIANTLVPLNNERTTSSLMRPDNYTSGTVYLDLSLDDSTTASNGHNRYDGFGNFSGSFPSSPISVSIAGSYGMNKVSFGAGGAYGNVYTFTWTQQSARQGKITYTQHSDNINPSIWTSKTLGLVGTYGGSTFKTL